MPSNGCSNPATPHWAPINLQVPDEILAMIVKFLDASESGSNSSYCDFTAQPALLACSLVCKRWRNIVLPHLFRSIHLIDPEITPVCFFLKTPVIADIVQALWLEQITIEDIDGLDRLLGTLPSLRWLKLDSVSIRGDDLSPERPLRYASHQLETLIYHSQSLTPLFHSFVTFVDLLPLFTEIGELRTNVIIDDELDDDNWPAEEDVDVFATMQTLNMSTTSTASSGRVPGPLIRKLSCQYDSNDISGASYFIPLYLFKLGIARNLTHLAFSSTCAVEWEAFLGCISAAHATLTCLCIEVASFTEHGIDNDVASLQPILSTCTSLSDLTLITHLPLLPGYFTPTDNTNDAIQPPVCIRHPDGQRLCYVYTSHQPRWLATMQILGSVSSRAPLRSVKIGLRGTCTNPHVLDWRQFREWCSIRIMTRKPVCNALPSPSSSPFDSAGESSTSSLQRIEVELDQVYDQTRCMEYEMREFIHTSTSGTGSGGVFIPMFNPPGKDCIVNDRNINMRARAQSDRLIVGYDECQDEGCRRYRGVE